MCLISILLFVVSTVLEVVISAMDVAALKKLDTAHLTDNTYGKMMAALDQIIHMVLCYLF